MKRNNQGFTLVELLVVLLIIAILAAIATPLYLQNARRARASEAVATMSLIRQAQRDFFVNRNTYVEIAADNIQDPLPGNVLAPATDGLSVNAGVAQYFSNDSYTVDTSSPAWAAGITPGNPTSPVDFVITVDGSDSSACANATDASCAVKEAQVSDIDLMMDNSGRIFVTYNATAGTPVWEQY